MPLELKLGVKSDPIEYRFSYEWLFRLMAEEGVTLLQLGSFFELYHLPDAFFHHLRRQAEDCGIRIHSLFTAHRELGGFFREEPGFEQAARRNYERFIEVGGLLGAKSVGSNPGAVMRDRMGFKARGVDCYLRHMKELMAYARARGVEWLTIEPMSCLAEPPTLPEEMRAMTDALNAFHEAQPDTTARAGFCVDVAHGYRDRSGACAWDNVALFEASLPGLYELHLKNTDARFESTFGFSPPEREKGIVQVETFRDLLLRRADLLPVQEIVGYLEIGGPKLGRDYTDSLLENSLRQSLRYLKQAFVEGTGNRGEVEHLNTRSALSTQRPVLFAPSLMCADLCHLETSVRRLEETGAAMLHFDLMDAHFTPNMPLGFVLIEQLRPKTALPFDAHLMVEDNDLFVRKLMPLGVQSISVHVESATHLDRTLSLIREAGIQAGAALNPATPLDALEWVKEKLDFVLIMTVNPGFAGQPLVSSGLRKIADCRAWLDSRGLAIPIQVDGNVSFAHIPAMVAAGADILVAGSSSLFHAEGSLHENVARMAQAIAEGLVKRTGASETSAAGLDTAFE